MWRNAAGFDRSTAGSKTGSRDKLLSMASVPRRHLADNDRVGIDQTHGGCGSNFAGGGRKPELLSIPDHQAPAAHHAAVVQELGEPHIGKIDFIHNGSKSMECTSPLTGSR
jgi:hypothetical protein